MTEYDVYALGNALLDIEFEVSPATLEKLGIDKGVMTLLDRDAQDKIVSNLAEYDTKRSCGGSAANTVIAISQLGGKAFYSCKVADDEPGKFYTQDLLNCGVATNLDTHLPESGVTGKCLVFVTPDAEIAQSAGKQVAFTLADLNMVKFFKSGLLEIIGSGVDFLFSNEGEAMLMAETENFDIAVDYLKTLAKRFAITRGAAGSVIFDGEKLIKIEPFPVKAIDTGGAGDMYAGAYGITNGMSYEEAGRLASKASSEIVTSLGARMKTEQVKALLN